ncbi:GNAT family N-acetyltransferase [Bosea sp. PAMC 26642]|uniref:GNAT family N-acetyltransferase n=1 Tax=Bosea sp. (strain PAMC 26642) TaxID=1792307 RepID=UPI00143AAD26|nr:GNAT family N-acetyltransferase [Bosea sp. PAMC 26642]
MLRPRNQGDLVRIAAMNSDPEVMRFIAPTDDPFMQVEGLAKRSFTYVAQGLGYWSVSRRGQDDDLIGYVGLIADGPALGRVELSYRFEMRHWGRGYAVEAASRLLAHAFEALGLAEIVIFTHPLNTASLKLAGRLGFVREADRPSAMMGLPDFPCAFLRLSQVRWRNDQTGIAIGRKAR